MLMSLKITFPCSACYDKQHGCVYLASVFMLLLGGYPSLTTTCAGLVEPRRSVRKLLKSAFNAENFICRLSWSISNHFDAIHS